MTGNQNSKLVGKLILQATITNTSPLLIASGKNDGCDFEIIRDSSGQPLIPGAGFAGMLSNSFKEIITDIKIRKHIKYFWGTDDDTELDTSQSHIIIDDLKIIDGYRIVERDGVAINHQTNLGKDGSKFDYELIEPGAKFHLNAEITLRNGFDKNTFLEFLLFMTQKGKDKQYQQGAFKSSGFGTLEWLDIRIYEFDFPKDGEEWFGYLQSHDPEKLINVVKNKKCSLVLKEKDILIIDGIFSLKSSLIIRSDGDQTNTNIKAPDKTHLKNTLGDALLTSKSLKGAIRHRAHKILKTIGYPKSDELIGELFGYVDEMEKSEKPSRVKTHETLINGADTEQIQPRIKIDRYTNSAIEHALMQSQPVWHKNESFTLKFEIKECKDFEAGLMLLVMKDLMKEDLPIGGEKAIGRGILTGSNLSVKGKVSNIDVDLNFNNAGITDNSKIGVVNNWVSELSNFNAL
ncbi:MAG: RAMP superfamily CRISPR-associated protein [bacterium]|nr:RAMP superfamily CRISPR-associated protein [bacterium]